MEALNTFKTMRKTLRVNYFPKTSVYILCYLLVATIINESIVEACRSSVDEDRQPIYSHHGTEPPEETTQHRTGRNSADIKPHPEEGAGAGGDNPDPKTHEEGEVKIITPGGERWEFPVAQTPKGMYWGYIEETRGGKRILSFRGIPYAQPPVGPLRWKPPKTNIPEWKGLREAKHNGHVCPQHMYYKPDVWIGKEDCLWLNVFTRDLVVKKKRKVVIWIHGGNFVRGSARDYDPDYLLDEDIVLVTINYRLGMFGFMSTEDREAGGNYGMLDQVAALRWVKANIEAFSGDPRYITIMGQQAGGASVHYHMLSPLSRGLFHRAVSLSGTALCWWASLKRPLERAIKLARLAECPYKITPNGTSMYENGDTTEKLVSCLREKDMETLMNTHPNFYEWRHLEQAQEPMNAWSPRVDPESPLPFMPMEPIDLMTGGSFTQVPWIVGLTDDEGAFKASAFFGAKDSDNHIKEFNEKFELLGPLMFGLHDGQTEAPKIQAQKVRDHYWGTELTRQNAKGLVNAISDSSYAHPIDTAAKIHAIKSQEPIYMYHFGYKGTNSFSQLDTDNYPPRKVLTDMVFEFGVGNGDDLLYLFPVLSGTFRPLPHEDLIFSQRYIHLLMTFAKTGRPVISMDILKGVEFELDEKGNPVTTTTTTTTTTTKKPPVTPGNYSETITTTTTEKTLFEWEPVHASSATHLDIGNIMKMDEGLPNHERMAFWIQMPSYWNCDRSAYKPAPPVAYKDEL